MFNNPNEKTNSHLFYDLLKADETKTIIEEKSFTDGDIFGFAAVIENDDTVELITSVGGTKITTLANKKDVEESFNNYDGDTAFNSVKLIKKITNGMPNKTETVLFNGGC